MKVLVTGGANGIGFAVINYLAERGITVYACDIKEKIFDSPLIKFFNVDVSDENSVQSLYQKLKEQGVLFDAIINVAGVFLINSFTEVSEQQLNRLFEVNFFGTLRVNRILYPLLKKNGRIVITTSEVACLDQMPFNGIYGVSKAALDSYSQALRQELNVLGQKVITVRPGAFNTGLSNGALVKTKELSENTQLYKGQSARFYGLVKTFMGNPKPPEKIAKCYYKAVSKKIPRLIYTKHKNLLLVLMNLLPKRLQCAIVKLMLNKKSKQTGAIK